MKCPVDLDWEHKRKFPVTYYLRYKDKNGDDQEVTSSTCRPYHLKHMARLNHTSGVNLIKELSLITPAYNKCLVTQQFITVNSSINVLKSKKTQHSIVIETLIDIINQNVFAPDYGLYKCIDFHSQALSDERLLISNLNNVIL